MSPAQLSTAAVWNCPSSRVFRPSRRRLSRALREALSRIPPGRRILVLFLGSTIGNFDRSTATAFLQSVRAVLTPGDLLLLGADLVKPVDRLLLAYDDPAGVTAAFNLNLLARINRELGADFDLSRFRHLARYDTGEERIEMHLQAMEEQSVNIASAECTVRFAAGETLWTESSHKYTMDGLDQIAQAGGFRVKASWTDDEWPFAESLWEAG
jgi:L-histidine Nalpha-methyltransferase